MRGKNFIYYNPIFHLFLALNLKSDTIYIFQIFYKIDRQVASLGTCLSMSQVNRAPLPSEPCSRTEAFRGTKEIKIPFPPDGPPVCDHGCNAWEEKWDAEPHSGFQDLIARQDSLQGTATENLGHLLKALPFISSLLNEFYFMLGLFISTLCLLCLIYCHMCAWCLQRVLSPLGLALQRVVSH